MGNPSDVFPAEIRPGLDRTRRGLALMGHPEEAFASVLIGGTNGKGSVSALMERVLRSAGYRTGHYTSPHLVDARERVRVNGTPISRPRWRALFARLARLRREARLPFTEFEAQTLAAFRHFADERVDIAVVEVGMGGRLDATNALPAPEVAVIASLGHDHARWLGTTLPEIYGEKRGIARAGTPLIQNVPPSLWKLSDAWDRRDGACSSLLGRDIQVRSVRVDWARATQSLDAVWPGGSLAGLRIGLMGPHQAANGSLAAAALGVLGRRGWRLTEHAMRTGFASARWPGRFQILSRHPPIVLDGAHNPEAAAALARTWRQAPWSKRPATLIFACFRDKDVDGVIRPLAALFARVVTTTLPTPRALSPEAAAAHGRRAGVRGDIWTAPNFGAAWRIAGEGKSGPVLIAGSLSLVGEAMRFFRRKP